MSHSPGPWHVLPTNPLCIEAADGNVGLVNLARGSEADAHLIAAAPELLEALRELVEQFDAYRNGWMGSWQDRVGLPRDMELAREAINKAEGRS